MKITFFAADGCFSSGITSLRACDIRHFNDPAVAVPRDVHLIQFTKGE